MQLYEVRNFMVVAFDRHTAEEVDRFAGLSRAFYDSRLFEGRKVWRCVGFSAVRFCLR